MEILRNIFGNLASGLIRLGVAVGILAAIGIFIVRPALDTTKQISHEANENIRRGINGGIPNQPDIDKILEDANTTVQREVKKSFHVAKVHGSPAAPNRLIKCIQHAHGDVHKIQRCAARF